MLTDDEIRQDLATLKEIVAAHKAEGTEYETRPTEIDGHTVEAFTRVPRTLADLYRLGLDAPDLDFLVYLQQRHGFAETLDLSARLARVLLETYGIHKGDRVALCARNCPEWCISYMAVTLIGAVIVPMNSWWKGSEILYGLDDSGARLLLADHARLESLSGQALQMPIIAIKPESESEHPEFYQLLEQAEPLSWEEINALGTAPDDNASIMYTSGSTDHPKGVLSSHRGIISAIYTWKFVKEINEILRPELQEPDPEYQPAILANVPLFHVTGSHAQFLSCFVYHRKFVMMYKWNPETALELIEQERISVFHGVPTMTWELMNSPRFENTDLSSLRQAQAGGAPRPPEHLVMMSRKFPERVLPGLGYGLTETNALGAIISGKFYLSRPNSTGRPTPPVTQVKIIGEDGEELGPDQVGEICIKGPSLMKGYWNKPEATAEVMKDGWFLTGDIGRLDPLGFLIIMDRAKDIVIRGGENIGCAEVEYAIVEHPAVSEVSVYGIPDERLGEVPCATVMLAQGQELSEQALKDFLGERIAAFKIPQHILFQREQLPRIASGKIAKKLLREQAISQRS